MKARLVLGVFGVLLAASLAAAQPTVTPAPSVSVAAQPQAASSGQDPKPQPPAPKWSDRISLSGFLSGDGRWRRAGEDGSISTTTDIYIRAFELGLEATVSPWLSATVVINSEYVGDPLNAGDSTVLVDEAHLDITVPGTPFYFVLGKRIQPFGLFETYLATDLMVQDAYETKAVGLTAGLKAPRDTDLSITAYKGRIRANHLAQSGLLGPAVPDFPELPSPRADSWIVSGMSSPTGDDWRISAALASEPGADRRSTTLNLGTYVSLPFYEHLEFNAEYMKALRRDDIPELGRSCRERTLSATLSYLLVTPEMTARAGRNYRARKTRRLSHPAVVALRFEALDDGGRSEALGTWSVKNRFCAGGRYTFFQQGPVDAALTLEYRRQTVRVSPAFEGTTPSANEFYIRFGLDF